MSLGEVVEFAAADLAHPSVIRSVAVREERHKPAVRRNRRIELRAFPVREPGEVSASQRALPAPRVVNPPKQRSGAEQKAGCDQKAKPSRPWAVDTGLRFDPTAGRLG